ncbi:Nif3-like dinuclear metal center hexameric protein [Clostridium chrysemydis]|uniref:Nif3-like dinuclear metal center hexameric protein n=1 Tax=Clostridium chrysemydis TaxID=2665504 RepID=UPI003F3C627D
MKKVKDIISVMENFAPPILKEDFDNVGLMVGDKEEKVSKVLLALDCTNSVIEEAKKNNCDMIITHHPLIFKKPNRIVKDDFLGNKIIELIKNDISLYSSHTNLDSVKGGINDTIVKMLGFEFNSIIEESNKGYDGAGLGRIVNLEEELDLNSLIEKIKSNLNVSNLRVVKGKERLKKIAIINGSGQSFFNDCIAEGVDCIITGDTTYHFASDLKELGITIIDPGHFKTEWLVFLSVMENIIEKFKDIEFIVSKESSDPYTFI